jgi:hypothetical protein
MSRTMTVRLDEGLWRRVTQVAGSNRSQFAREAIEEKLARTRPTRFKCLDYAGSLRLPSNASSSREWLGRQITTKAHAQKNR